MNYTQIAGHLGSDPETRFTPSGRKVTSLRVACRARKNGADSTMWWRVTIWGETFDKILPYFKKGSPIVVCGEMAPPDIYQNREGSTQVSLEITAHHISFSPFGKGRSENNNQAQQAAPSDSFSAAPEAPQAFAAETASSTHVSDDEIPF